MKPPTESLDGAYRQQPTATRMMSSTTLVDPVPPPPEPSPDMPLSTQRVQGIM